MKELPTVPLQELIRTMMGTTLVGVVLLVVALAVSSLTGSNKTGVVGAGLETAEQESSASGIPKLEEGWNWYENSRQSYTVALPANWQRIDLEPQAMDFSIKEAAQNDSQLVGLLTAQARQVAASGADFFAVDSSEGGADKKYVTNLNITKGPLERSGTDLDGYAELSLKRLEGLDTTIKPIDHSRTRIAAGVAEVFEHQMKTEASKDAANLAVTQYAVITEGGSYLITFTTPSALSERYAPVFRMSAESFHLTGAAELAAGSNASGNANPTAGNAPPAANSAAAVSLGVVQGQVTDATTGRPIAGATVRIKGSSISANTDISGSYQLTKAPAGDRRAVVSSDS
ncbi:MAG: carboxypeptidase-like regulatory domain-containing protein, partial [Dehalococcoidia bacterium]|nr:carboxypeptidase-like regulatory domain-containing protein [Dehalococcoidia bacterium]